MHKRLRKLAIAVLAATSVVLVAVAPSLASSSTAVSGIVVPTSADLTARTAGGNLLIDGSGTHSWTGSPTSPPGTLTGTSDIDVHFVVHPSGVVTYQAFLTFTGTTPCGSGTIRLISSGSGPFPGPITGQATTIDQADASVPLHAQLNVVLFLTPAGALVTYTGDVRCD